MPMTSGRTYCTTAALCRPRAPGNVALEAGNAEAMFLGAQSLQKQGGQAHHNARDDYEPVLFEKPFHFINGSFLSLQNAYKAHYIRRFFSRPTVFFNEIFYLFKKSITIG